MFYTVKLLDSDGCELAMHEHDSLKDAKVAAKAAIAEKEYLDAGANKVEILNEQGICVWDRFANIPRCSDCGSPGERKGHMSCQYPQN
jgi:hypothetical protein